MVSSTIIRWSVAVILGVPALTIIGYVGLCIVAVGVAIAQAL